MTVSLITTTEIKWNGKSYYSVCCSVCGAIHPNRTTIRRVKRATDGVLAILCDKCANISLFDLGLNVGQTYVKSWAAEGPLHRWLAVKVATADEQEGIYRAMRILDSALDKLKGEEQ